MIEKDKNKSRLKAKSKNLVLGLILIAVVGVGFFGSVGEVNASKHEVKVTCNVDGDGDPLTNDDPRTFEIPSSGSSSEKARAKCAERQSALGVTMTYVSWEPTTNNPATNSASATNNPNKSDFENAMNSRSCASLLHGFDIAWCFVRVAYVLFYAFPAFLLWASASFFNVLISITLSSRLFADSTFIPPAWAIVRDLSNIFFILILLYIAIKIILDIGGSEAKKMIAKVIIVALLINFSMFMTEVVIDTSNITALIFYNKINVCTNRNAETGDCRKYDDVTGEKDVAGGLTSKFDPTKALNEDFFKKAGNQPVPGRVEPISSEVPAGIMFGIIMITGLLMFFAAYVLFISGFSFLGRLIELWILIIFSPFAFMSFSIPLLGKIEYIGWKDWSSNLIKVSFMAPIFMFFLYFIFRLAEVNVFNGLITKTEPTSFIESLLLIILPTLMILILLYKAVKFAEKGGGVVADIMGSFGKVVLGVAGGVAGGLAIGGLAKGLQAGGGYVGERILRNKKWAEYESAEKEDQTGRFRGVKAGLKRFTGGGLRTIAGGTNADGKGGLVGSSFDLRKGAVSGLLKSAESVTGLNFGSASKILLKPDGGHRGDQKRAEEKRIARNDSLKVARDEPLQQELNEAKEGLSKTKNTSSFNIGQIENQIEATKKNRETMRLSKESAESKVEVTEKALEAFGEKKAKTTLDNTASISKTAQNEADAAREAADKATSAAKTDIEKSVAAHARIIADTKENLAKKAGDAHRIAVADYDAIIKNPEYVAIKAEHETNKDAFAEAATAFQEQTNIIKALTKRRAKIKGAEAIVDTDGKIDMAENEKNFNKYEEEFAEAEKLLNIAKTNEIGARASLRNVTSDTNEEKEYDKTKTAFNNIETDKKNKEKIANEAQVTFDNLVDSGVDVNDLEYKAAEDAKNIAAAAVTAITEIHKAAEDAKNAAATAVTAINPNYVRIKDNYDITKDALEVIKEKANESMAKKEIATAVLASARFGEGKSINEQEDKYIPELEEKIEHENRTRRITDAENLRTEFKNPIAKILRALATPAGDNKYSRNAAAHKIIEEVSKKRV